MIPWEHVESQLEKLQNGLLKLEDLHPQTLDTLHGSMWGLNHRYKTLFAAMEEDKDKIIAYSLHRIRLLLGKNKAKFPRCEPKKPAVGLGTYGWKYDHHIIQEAVRLDVPLIDTAEGYGYGKVETELGKALQGISCNRVATKVRRDHMSEASFEMAAFRSKKKLGSIPWIFQTHFPNDRHSEAFIARMFNRLWRWGYTKHVGLGNSSIDQVELVQRNLREIHLYSIQVRYNLMDRRIEESLLPYCQERQILVIAYSPLGQQFKKLHRPILDHIAREIGCTPVQVALAWICRHPGAVPIPRTNNIRHLNENVEASQIKLTSSQISVLEEEYGKWVVHKAHP